MRCAIFCTIIDNFGDIGVCWRLARQLAADYQFEVDLFVDDLASFAILAPELKPDLPVQLLGQITVYHWHSQLSFEQVYKLVIEGFACRLSDTLIVQMHQQAIAGQAPLWINLEYLSAEPWAIDCHGMVSIHPVTGLEQTFWFPSTTENSGGLIREKDLMSQRDQFQQNLNQQAVFWQNMGIIDIAQFTRKISLFSYENNAIADLLEALATDSATTLLLIPKSKSIPDIEHWLGKPLEIGHQVTQHNLTILMLPFLSQDHYDRLLWACDLNFVRGEDSCIRAQYAGRPFIWHIYPQDENTHLVKLQAWMDRVNEHTQTLVSWHRAMHIWNGAKASSSTTWQALLHDLLLWNTQLSQWGDYLVAQSSLVTRLVEWTTQQDNT